MKKSIIIVIAIIVIAAVLGAVFMFIKGNTSNNTQGGQGGLLPPVATGTPGQSISSTLAAAPTGSTFQIGTPQGSVTVNNIYASNDYVTLDGQTIVIAQSEDYSIVYNVSDSSFVIALTFVPGSLQAARDAAESVFLQKLGISKEDACKLNVNEGVTEKGSPYYGQSLGLSFCGIGGVSGAGSVPSSTGQ